jgi:hypothetical protein
MFTGSFSPKETARNQVLSVGWRTRRMCYPMTINKSLSTVLCGVSRVASEQWIKLEENGSPCTHTISIVYVKC